VSHDWLGQHGEEAGKIAQASSVNLEFAHVPEWQTGETACPNV
jgi:hypothetical protein